MRVDCGTTESLACGLRRPDPAKLLIWLGVSITMHAFPSTGDVASIWAADRSRGTGLATRVIATPIVGLIYLGALGSFFWLDLFYGIAVAAALPAALVRIL